MATPLGPETATGTEPFTPVKTMLIVAPASPVTSMSPRGLVASAKFIGSAALLLRLMPGALGATVSTRIDAGVAAVFPLPSPSVKTFSVTEIVSVVVELAGGVKVAVYEDAGSCKSGERVRQTQQCRNA